VRQAAGEGEVKSMWVEPHHRGAGLGRALLAAVEATAHELGIRTLRLETGIHQAAAMELYRGAGYREIGPFGDYKPDPLSIFREKRLDAEVG
jgi:putative acetyltransferase